MKYGLMVFNQGNSNARKDLSSLGCMDTQDLTSNGDAETHQ